MSFGTGVGSGGRLAGCVDTGVLAGAFGCEFPGSALDVDAATADATGCEEAGPGALPFVRGGSA